LRTLSRRPSGGLCFRSVCASRNLAIAFELHRAATHESASPAEKASSTCFCSCTAYRASRILLNKGSSSGMVNENDRYPNARTARSWRLPRWLLFERVCRRPMIASRCDVWSKFPAPKIHREERACKPASKRSVFVFGDSINWERLVTNLFRTSDETAPRVPFIEILPMMAPTAMIAPCCLPHCPQRSAVY